MSDPRELAMLYNIGQQLERIGGQLQRIADALEDPAPFNVRVTEESL